MSHRSSASSQHRVPCVSAGVGNECLLQRAELPFTGLAYGSDFLETVRVAVTDPVQLVVICTHIKADAL